MAMAFPNDNDLEVLFPKCPTEGVEQVHQKQYAFFRKFLIEFVKKSREMLLPLGEQQIRFILSPYATSLRHFLLAKQGKKLAVVKPQPLRAKAVEAPAPVVPPAETVPPVGMTTEQKLTAEAGGKPNDEK